MNVVLWVVQVLVAVGFAIAGYSKAFRYERARERMPWVRDVPRGFTRTIGALEILGAAGLALLQVLATLFHVTRREWRNLPVNAVLVALALVAACGRFVVVPF